MSIQNALGEPQRYQGRLLTEMSRQELMEALWHAIAVAGEAGHDLERDPFLAATAGGQAMLRDSWR